LRCSWVTLKPISQGATNIGCIRGGLGSVGTFDGTVANHQRDTVGGGCRSGHVQSQKQQKAHKKEMETSHRNTPDLALPKIQKPFGLRNVAEILEANIPTSPPSTCIVSDSKSQLPLKNVINITLLISTKSSSGLDPDEILPLDKNDGISCISAAHYS
jgi:hypothetical protein